MIDVDKLKDKIINYINLSDVESITQTINSPNNRDCSTDINAVFTCADGAVMTIIIDGVSNLDE